MKKKYVLIIVIVLVACLSISTFFALKHYFSDRETINRRFGVGLPNSFSIVEYYKYSDVVTAAKIKCGNEEDVDKFIKSLSGYVAVDKETLQNEGTNESNHVGWWDINKSDVVSSYEKRFVKNKRIKLVGLMRIYVTNDNYIYMYWYY